MSEGAAAGVTVMTCVALESSVVVAEASVVVAEVSVVVGVGELCARAVAALPVDLAVLLEVSSDVVSLSVGSAVACALLAELCVEVPALPLDLLEDFVAVAVAVEEVSFSSSPSPSVSVAVELSPLVVLVLAARAYICSWSCS